jgi:addiction module HigA family antidote
LYEDDDRKGLPADAVEKLRKMLAFIQDMEDPDELRALATWRAHLLSGSRKGTWSLHVTRNWRLTFRVDDQENEIVDLDYEDYHEGQTTMRRMLNPPHPGHFIRTEIIAGYGLTVTEAASILGVSRPTLSTLLNAKGDLSGDMALRLEKAFGVKMDTLMRMQNSYDIARTRRRERTIRVRRYRGGARTHGKPATAPA